MADKLPTVTQELVDYLAFVFPNQCPNPTDTEREIWMAVGAQKIITHIRSILLPEAKSPDDSIL